jgi:Family of unknown function (DUF6232)
MNQMQYQYNEDGYYSDGFVWVTSQRLVYGGVEHPLRGVRSARVRIIRAEDRMRSYYMLMLGSIGVILFMLFDPILVRRDGTFWDAISTILQYFAAGALVLAFGMSIVFLVNRKKMPKEPMYTVSVRYRFWSRTAVASTDQAYIERIVEVIQYALARRDDTAYAMASPASIGRSFEVPTPTIRVNTLYAGQATYDLAEIRSANVYAMYNPSVGQILLLGLFTIRALSDYASQYLDAPWSTFASVIGHVNIIMIGAILLFTPANTWADVYTVALIPRTGARAIVFASTSKSDAKQVQQSINASKRPEAAPRTA